MKRTRILAYLFNLYSMSAVAGYHCQLSLSHTEDLKATVAQKALQVKTGNLNSGNMGTLLVENSNFRKTVAVEINAVMSGWSNEEDATFVMMRTVRKKKSTNAERISEVITVKGNDHETLWFDSYKLEIDCSVK